MKNTKILIDDIEELNLYDDILAHYSTQPSIKEFLVQEITHLDLDQSDWITEKNLRRNRNYTLGEDSELIQNLAISDVYSYEIRNSEILGYKRVINYFKKPIFNEETEKYEAVIGVEKLTTNETRLGHLTELNRSIRISQIDYLRESGKNLRATSEFVPEPYKSAMIKVADATDTLLDHYLDTINRCYVFGFSEWITQMLIDKDGSDDIAKALNEFVNEQGVRAYEVMIDAVTIQDEDIPENVEDL